MQESGFCNWLLFQNSSWVIVPHAKNKAKIETWIRSFVAKPIVMSAGEHDRKAALISHLPALISKVLWAFVQDQDPTSLKLTATEVMDDWVSYPEMVRQASATPVIVQTRWKLTPKLLSAHITKKTRILILNNGCNPTGILYTREEIAKLLKIAHEANLIVISDEVYSEIVFDDFHTPRYDAWLPGM